MDLNEEDSVVLVTNYHVIIGGLPESYKKAKKVSKVMRKKILENARGSEIKLEGKKINLSGGLLVEVSCKISSAKSVCSYVAVRTVHTYIHICTYNYYTCIYELSY